MAIDEHISEMLRNQGVCDLGFANVSDGPSGFEHAISIVLPVSGQVQESLCNRCDLCVKACPAGAIKGVEWRKDIQRSDLFDAVACNRYMREHFMKIGRGSVCGICVKVCPHHASAKTLTDITGQSTIKK